jgi:hypothetical protein
MRRWALAASLVLTLACRASAWDLAGHMVTGEIAWSLLSPVAREKVAALARRLPNKYNAQQPYHLSTACAWLDDMRATRGYQWSAWHYVTQDWTPDASGFALPAGPHVVWAIVHCEEQLRRGGLSPAEEAEAFGILIHCIGDVHQPLHTASRQNDRGGNGYLIYGVPFTDLFPGSVPNLHTLWDAAYRFDGKDDAIFEVWKAPKVEERSSAIGMGIAAQEAQKLLAEFPRTSFAEGELQGAAEDWARESYVLACRQGYPPGEPPSQTEVRKIEPEFSHAAQAIAKRRLVQAGYRLAAVLERVFGTHHQPEASTAGD